MNVTLPEVDYRYNVLMEKLNLIVKNRQPIDEETYKEISEVMHLKYIDGSNF